MKMPRGLVPLLLLLMATTTRGLRAGLDNFKPCSGGSGSFIDDILCDPDHLVSPEESYNIGQLLTKCGEEAGHVRVMVFLAASFTSDDNVKPTNAAAITTTTNGTSRDSGDGGDKGSINLLKELVVTSNKLNSSTSTTTTENTTSTTSFSSSSIILLVAIKDPFQLATWHSAALDGVLTTATLEEAKQRVDTPVDQQHFTSAVVHVAHQLCQSARRSQSRALRDIILTVVWIAITSAFVTLLVVIVMALIRARHRAVTSARAEAGKDQTKRQESRRYPITSTSDIQDLSVVYYKPAGNVLLGTTDITAVPAQDCSSTDNLLQA